MAPSELLLEAMATDSSSCFEIPLHSNEEPRPLDKFRLSSIPKPSLAQGKTTFWLLKMDGFDFHPYIGYLNELELDRIAQLKSVKERWERSSARVFLRLVLSHYSNTAPGEIAFTYGPEGKPQIEASFSFNSSHSQGLMAVVVCGAQEVGVDLEGSHLTENAFLSIANRFFSKDEVAVLLGQTSSKRAKLFQQIWTLKEAWIKSKGLGITSVQKAPDFSQILNLCGQDELKFMNCGDLHGFQFDYQGATCTAFATNPN